MRQIIKLDLRSLVNFQTSHIHSCICVQIVLQFYTEQAAACAHLFVHALVNALVLQGGPRARKINRLQTWQVWTKGG